MAPLKRKPEFYLDGAHAWEAMLTACEQARHSIDLEQYIFMVDTIGRRFIDVLMRKRIEGVRVRIICDTVGSFSFYNSTVPAMLRDAGIEIRFFNIVSPWRIRDIFSWYFRDHRKILVVDEAVGFTGGVGIHDAMRTWRDTSVRVTGPTAREMQDAFEEMWDLAAEKNIFSRLKKFKRYHRGERLVTNAPYPRRRFLYHTFIQALRSARQYAFLTTPYFVPNQRFVKELRRAVARGVDVKILVPETYDVILVNRASHSFFHEILEAGAHIYTYSGAFLHAKTAVIDDTWATIGSFNFDNLSFTYNHEANIVSMDQAFIKPLKSHFLADIAHSKEILLETWKKRPLIWKLHEFFVLPIRRFL